MKKVLRIEVRQEGRPYHRTMDRLTAEEWREKIDALARRYLEKNGWKVVTTVVEGR